MRQSDSAILIDVLSCRDLAVSESWMFFSLIPNSELRSIFIPNPYFFYFLLYIFSPTLFYLLSMNGNIFRDGWPVLSTMRVVFNEAIFEGSH